MIEPLTIVLVFYFMDKELIVCAMIQYTCQKPLSMHNLLNQTEWVNWKVPSGIYLYP